MDNSLLLHILMGVHTLIGAANVACLVYLPYAAFKRRSPLRDHLLLAALILPGLNLVLMAANGMACPLQNVAQALAGVRAGHVRDMYLVPESWLAVVPWTFPIGYFTGAALVFGRLLFAKYPALRS